MKRRASLGPKRAPIPPSTGPRRLRRLIMGGPVPKLYPSLGGNHRPRPVPAPFPIFTPPTQTPHPHMALFRHPRTPLSAVLPRGACSPQTRSPSSPPLRRSVTHSPSTLLQLTWYRSWPAWSTILGLLLLLGSCSSLSFPSSLLFFLQLITAGRSDLNSCRAEPAPALPLPFAPPQDSFDTIADVFEERVLATVDKASDRE